MIRLFLVVSLISHDGVKLLIPLLGSLLQYVQGLLQPTFQVLLPFPHKSLWLLYVDLLEVIVNEHHLNIKLYNLKLHARCNAQHHPDGCHLDYRGKDLIKIYSFLLLEAFHHDPGFVPWWISNISLLQLEHPLLLERCREDPSLCADREVEPPGSWTGRIQSLH